MGTSVMAPEDPTSGRLARLRSRGEERANRYAARYAELARRVPLLRVPLEMATLYVARQGMLLASAVAFRAFLWWRPWRCSRPGCWRASEPHRRQRPPTSSPRPA
ncbi:hypothetical protein GCM10009868_35340 [Terrabacter aerolatus]|uniref:Uncharacterized protein n=1 Tax=Terrabacter aerolatus TaxID=422442 RepID=A0A512CW84_9MICO|nr:hypothetical protein TAE01_02920 [Terrabacter aerolatus]